MRRLLAVLLALVVVLLPGRLAMAGGPTLPFEPGTGDPPGANDWTCRPSAAHPVPVVLVHGTFADRKSLLEELSRRIHGAGFCVFSLDYGDNATGDIRASARQLKRFVRKVLDATGARHVSLVGHSQGGMMPRYFIKFLGGGRLVDDLVGVAPSNHGAQAAEPTLEPAVVPLLGLTCVACRQQLAGSPFLRRLNAGDETPGPVSYTVLTTRNDEVVVPYTSGFLARGARTTNLTVQDLCPDEDADHVYLPSRTATIAVVLDALAHPGPADARIAPPC